MERKLNKINLHKEQTPYHLAQMKKLSWWLRQSIIMTTNIKCMKNHYSTFIKLWKLVDYLHHTRPLRWGNDFGGHLVIWGDASSTHPCKYCLITSMSLYFNYYKIYILPLLSTPIYISLYSWFTFHIGAQIENLFNIFIKRKHLTKNSFLPFLLQNFIHPTKKEIGKENENKQKKP